MRFIVAFSRALTRKRTPVRPGPDAAGPRSARSTSYFRSRFLFASLEVSGEGTISGFIRLALRPARRSPSHRARFPWLQGGKAWNSWCVERVDSFTIAAWILQASDVDLLGRLSWRPAFCPLGTRRFLGNQLHISIPGMPSDGKEGPRAAAAAPAVRYIEVTADEAGQRIDNYLIARLKGVPKSRIYRILRSGEVRINMKRVDAAQRVAAGDRIPGAPVRVATREAPEPAPHFRLPLIF